MATLIHQPCDKCGSSDAKAYYDDGGTKCFSCGDLTWKSNTRATPQLPVNSVIPVWPAHHLRDWSTQVEKWLSLRGVSRELASKYGLRAIYNDNTLFTPQWDATGAFIRYQTRDLESKKIRTFGRPRDSAFYSHPKNTKQLCIVEDAISCMRVGVHMDAVALTTTSMASSTLVNITNKGYTHYIVWLDADTAGIEGTRKLYSQLNKFGDVICILNTKEPKWMTDHEILHTLGRFDNWES